MMLDVDNFKQRNDRYGHDEGDSTLKRLAILLARGVREADLVVRYGGEEFVLLLPETDYRTTGADVEQTASWPWCADMKWGRDQVTVSGGVAELQPSIVQPHEIVTRADKALYAAKRARGKIASSVGLGIAKAEK